MPSSLRSATGAVRQLLIAATATLVAAAPAVVSAPAAGTAAAAPWFATLLAGGATSAAEPQCGGALISPTRVVTAAHCVQERTPADLQVRIGDRSLRAGAGTVVPIAGFSVHPDFALIPVPGSRSGADDTARADVAIIELARPVTTVTPLALATGTPPAGAETVAFGHGRARERRDGNDVPEHKDRLGRSAQRVLDRADCRTRAGNQVVDPTMLCTRLVAEPANPPICAGDSGGPLVRRIGTADVLVGVISAQTSGTGTICQTRRSAALSTDLAAFRDWLTGPRQLAPVPTGRARVQQSTDGASRCAPPAWRVGTAPDQVRYLWFSGAGDTWLPLDGQTAATYGGPIPAAFLRCGIYATNAGGTTFVLSR